MATLSDYIYSIEGVSGDSTGDGFCVLSALELEGTGTCGSVGTVVLPSMTCEGHADWAPFADCTLPSLTVEGVEAGYNPAWGEVTLPAMDAWGVARGENKGNVFLPSLFCTGQTGAVGEVTLPLPTVYALDDSFNRTGDGDCVLPALTVESKLCGLDFPLNDPISSTSIVGLLQQGNPAILAAAEKISAIYPRGDALALALTREVASFVYTSDSASGLGDRWTCASATLARRYGDCEDGAFLLHSMMLAAGIDPGRVRTAVGTIKVDGVLSGHAWVLYRRETDEEWIVLDWTLGTNNYTGAVSEQSPYLSLSNLFTNIAYILTESAFFQVEDTYPNLLVVNRSVGDVVLYPLSVESKAGERGSADLIFFEDYLERFDMQVWGDSGATAVMDLPALNVVGTAIVRHFGLGGIDLPSLTVSGQCGSVAGVILPVLDISGRTGENGRADDLTLPSLSISGTARADNRASGSISFPRLRVDGTALIGQTMGAVAYLPAITVYGRALQGPVGKGSIKLSMKVYGTARSSAVASGDVELPVIDTKGAAGVNAPWPTEILHYDQEG